MRTNEWIVGSLACANFTGIGDLEVNDELHTVVAARNIVGQGVRYHLQLPYQIANGWFSISNNFVGWPDSNQVVTPFLDSASAPVNFAP